MTLWAQAGKPAGNVSVFLQQSNRSGVSHVTENMQLQSSLVICAHANHPRYMVPIQDLDEHE